MEYNDQIQQILERNKRVEMDKAWETSLTRRGFIAIITYITALAFLYLIDNPLFWLNACVPAAGYILSTLSLPPLKRLWLKGK
jgi:hypothetical protein